MHTLAFITKLPQPVICLIETHRWKPSDAVRLEFAILSLNRGLRQRCVAPDV